MATIQSHLLSVDVAVLDEGGAADVDGDVLGRLAVPVVLYNICISCI